MFEYTKNEIRDLIIAFIVLVIAFAISTVGLNLHGFLSILPIIMIGVGLGFMFREIGHKYVAMKYGYFAEFKIWPIGLLIALATAFLGFVFAAPGEIKIHAEELSDEISGRIAAAGPMANMSLAFIFLVIAILAYPFEAYLKIFKLILLISTVGYSVNSFLAAFNLFPIYSLDGIKVFKWNAKIWIILFALGLIMLFLSIFIGAENMIMFIIEMSGI